MTIGMGDLSKYRGELMGLAMLFVMLFHVGMDRQSMMYAVHRCGNVGVDMFLFLSGIGLWHAWTKNPSLRRFYWRRYVRIYPAWLIVACAYYIPTFVKTGGWGYTPNVGHLLANIAVNWSFWRADELTFWFIPAIMMMYTFAPFYMKLVLRHPIYRWMPVVAMVWAVMVQYYPPVHQQVGHVEIFWSRIPIFLLGINCGQAVKEDRRLEPSAIWLVLLVFVLCFMMCIEFEEHWRGRFPLFLERMVYIPFTVAILLLLVQLLRRTPRWVNRTFAFVGMLSLEAYLIHIEFVLKVVDDYRLGYVLTSLIVIAVSLAAAWVLHKLVSLLIKRLPKEI